MISRLNSISFTSKYDDPNTNPIVSEILDTLANFDPINVTQLPSKEASGALKSYFILNKRGTATGLAADPESQKHKTGEEILASFNLPKDRETSSVQSDPNVGIPEFKVPLSIALNYATFLMSQNNGLTSELPEISSGIKYEREQFEPIKIEEKITEINKREYCPQIIEPKISQKAQDSIQKTRLIVEQAQRAVITEAYALIDTLNSEVASDEDIFKIRDILVKLDKIALVYAYLGDKKLSSEASRAYNDLATTLSLYQGSVPRETSWEEIEKIQTSLSEEFDKLLESKPKYFLEELETRPKIRFVEEYDPKTGKFVFKPTK